MPSERPPTAAVVSVALQAPSFNAIVAAHLCLLPLLQSPSPYRALHAPPLMHAAHCSSGCIAYMLVGSASTCWRWWASWCSSAVQASTTKYSRAACQVGADRIGQGLHEQA